MKKILFLILTIAVLSSCSSGASLEESDNSVVEPTKAVIPEIVFDQVIDQGKLYSPKDFFDAGFKEYKEYNVSKLPAATEAWYGFWGETEEHVKYFELRFYPNHSEAVEQGTAYAADASGWDAKLSRKDAMWWVGLAERKVNMLKTSHGTFGERNEKVPRTAAKYATYQIFNNVIIMCPGLHHTGMTEEEDTLEAQTNCSNLIDLVTK